MRVAASFRVNGRKIELDLEPLASLAEVLRGPIGLTGTKISCTAGDCGACSVLLDGRPVPSCQVLAATVSGDVTTVEGLEGAEAEALRAAFIEQGAFQCGFCTSGQLVACTSLLARSPTMTDSQIAEALGGNICRCTGYAGIIRALRAAEVAIHSK